MSDACNIDDVEEVAKDWLGPKALDRFLVALRRHLEAQGEKPKIEITDTDRAHARRVARRHGFHVSRKRKR